MSKLKTTNGDDHPEASQKHLLDAQTLLAQNRFDGAAYLSGYVVECALKSLWLHETGIASPKMPWGKQGHSLTFLASHVSALSTVAGAKTARYVKATTTAIPTSGIAAWTSEMRYRPATATAVNATDWYAFANNVFNETVAQMRLDGVI